MRARVISRIPIRAFLALGALLSACNAGINGISEETLEAAASAASSRRLSESYTLTNTVAGMTLTANFADMDGTGTVYYAVYDADPGTMTPDDVKTAASSAVSGSLVARGSIAVSATSTNFSATVNGLADKKLYTLVAVAEDGSGLADAAKVKKIGTVLPKALTELTWTKVGAPSAGTLIRYIAHLPPGYYEHPEKSYPLIVWIHGNGESSNDGTNAEGPFAVMYKAGFFKRVYGGFDDIPAIIVGAQCNYAFFSCAGQQDYSLHKEMIDEAEAKFRVDTKRVYLSGTSYGGVGSYTLAHHYPTLIAGILTMSAAPYETGATLCTSLGANNVAVWSMMNRDDGIFSNEGLQTVISALRGCTADAKAKPQITIFATGTWPNTIENHGSAENLGLGLPLYYGGNWLYWNGTAQATDTDPPSHYVQPPVELTTLTPGMTADAPVIQTSSFSTAAADAGVTVTRAVDWLLSFSKP